MASDGQKAQFYKKGDEHFKFSSEKSVGNLNFFTLTVLEFPSENMGENLLAKLQIFFTPDCL
jgi:hypothetical protein